MELISFSAASGSLQRFITTELAGFMVKVAFKGRATTTTAVSLLDVSETLDDFYNSINGRLEVTVSEADKAPHRIYPNKPFIEVIEAMNELGGNIVITKVDPSNASDLNYIAEFYLPLSLFGTYKFSDKVKLNMEFAGFTNPALIGGGGTADTVISFESFLMPTYSNILVQLEPIAIAVGESQGKDILKYNALLLPTTLQKVLINYVEGPQMTVTDTNFGRMFNQFSPEGIRCLGAKQNYHKWVAIDVTKADHVNVELASGTNYYAFSNVPR